MTRPRYTLREHFAVTAFWAACAMLVVVVLLWMAHDTSRVPRVEYVPGRGCVVEVEWGSLSRWQKAEVGKRLNVCTEHHFPDTQVRW